MTDEECPGFDDTLRAMLNTRPVVRPLRTLKPQEPRDGAATQDGDDVVDATEEDEGEN